MQKKYETCSYAFCAFLKNYSLHFGVFANQHQSERCQMPFYSSAVRMSVPIFLFFASPEQIIHASLQSRFLLAKLPSSSNKRTVHSGYYYSIIFADS